MLFSSNVDRDLTEASSVCTFWNITVEFWLFTCLSFISLNQKFKKLPSHLQSEYGTELAVWSGDIVTKDQQDYLYFVGRNDDMIKSSGYRISPSELEEIASTHPSIQQVAALGVAHRQLGQAILLVLTLVPNKPANQQELMKFLKKQLPNFMHPHFLEIVDSLPRNPNGKINRPLLQEQYRYLAI